MCQFGDVFAALAQRRQVDRHAAQPVEEVFAESSLLDQGVQVLVRRGHDADVHRDALAAAQPLETSLLKQSQNLGLRVGRHVADFVQEQRAAVALLELADAAAVRAGKRSSFVAEQFAFQQRLGNGRTVDRQERRLAAAAVMIEGPGDQFLARPALAENQHIDVLGSNAADLLADRLHRRPAADQPVGLVLRPVAIVQDGRHVHQPADGESLIHHLLQLPGIQRLDQVVVGPQFHRLDRRLGRAVSRDENHEALGVDSPQVVKHIQSRAVAQPDVQQNHVGGRFGGQTQTFGGRFGPQHGHVVAVEDRFDAELDARFVVNDQQSVHGNPNRDESRSGAGPP